MTTGRRSGASRATAAASAPGGRDAIVVVTGTSRASRSRTARPMMRSDVAFSTVSTKATPPVARRGHRHTMGGILVRRLLVLGDIGNGCRAGGCRIGRERAEPDQGRELLVLLCDL